VVKTCAQDSTIHAYVGLSRNFFGITDAGWGTELGVQYNNIYFGIEYGYYGIGKYNQSDYTGIIIVPLNNPAEANYYANDPHLPTTRENYYSIHGGMIIKDIFWFGYAAMASVQSSIHPVWQIGQGYGWLPVTSLWFDIGPDVRIEGWNHLLLDLSYSHRRGIKSGIGYIFW
jgi:hypothetical protein